MSRNSPLSLASTPRLLWIQSQSSGLLNNELSKSFCKGFAKERKRQTGTKISWTFAMSVSIRCWLLLRNAVEPANWKPTSRAVERSMSARRENSVSPIRSEFDGHPMGNFFSTSDSATAVARQRTAREFLDRESRSLRLTPLNSSTPVSQKTTPRRDDNAYERYHNHRIKKGPIAGNGASRVNPKSREFKTML